jgi:predicted dinucleotide-binding enzyme
MRLAVIGTGRMGTALGSRLASAGHHVQVGSRDPGRGRQQALRIGAASGGSYRDALVGAGAVVLAVPWSAIRETLESLGNLDGRILIDVTNPFRQGSSVEQLCFPDSSGSEQLQAIVPRARVVKAWNTLYSEVLRSDSDFGGIAPTVFVAGDDPEAKEIVSGLVRDLGFEAADAGPLSSARYLEPLAGLMTSLDRRASGRTEHALRLLERAAPARGQSPRGTSSKRSTSTRPRSVIFSDGITDRARNARV